MTPQEAIKKLREDVKMGNMFGNVDVTEYKMAIEALQFQQEFVTCKDCKHWDLSESYGFARMCEHWQDTMLEYGYCSYGERRDEE